MGKEIVRICSKQQSGLRRSRVPSRPAGRDPGRDGTGFFKGIFEKTRPVEIVQKT